MEGVILFADDKVFEAGTPENKLYLKLAKEYPVLAVDTIALADNAIQSIGTFSAIILDWEFKVNLGGNIITRHPNSILDNSNFYSLVYVFSNLQIPDSTKRKYKKKFDRRIVFKKKSSGPVSQALSRNYNKIRNGVSNWQINNQNQTVPLNWGSSINQSIQKIFSDLSNADPNWIIELHKSAEGAVNPEIEVINLLQCLLSEQLIMDSNLIDSIKQLVQNPPANISNKGLAELFQRIYYTDLRQLDLAAAPIMTGDIFKLGSGNSDFGIIITPECDIKKVINDPTQSFQILKFKRKDFNDFINKTYNPANTANFKLKDDKKKKVADFFNQPNDKLFFLASFPFSKNQYSLPALIDFSNSIQQITYAQIQNKVRISKLNMPFIHQLRQKYLSYIGRVGVPTIPSALRTINLSHL